MAGDFSIAVADADQYRIAFAGVPIARGAGQSGLADGEYLNGTQKKESFTYVEGTDGSVARSKTNSRMVELGLNLLQTSTSNAYLSSMLALDENTANGAGIGSFVVTDLQGTTLLLCTRAWVVKPADVSLDRGAKERKWTFHGIKSIWVIGGN